MKASVGTVGDSCDNALAESIIGLYKTEVIERQGWCGAGDVELSTLEWVDWFNQRRLLSSIGYTPPVEFEAAYYRQKDGLDKAPDPIHPPSDNFGAVQKPQQGGILLAALDDDSGDVGKRKPHQQPRPRHGQRVGIAQQRG